MNNNSSGSTSATGHLPYHHHQFGAHTSSALSAGSSYGQGAAAVGTGGGRDTPDEGEKSYACDCEQHLYHLLFQCFTLFDFAIAFWNI